MATPIDAIYDLGISHNKFSLPLPDGTFYPDYMFASDKRPGEFLTHFDRVRNKDWADCSFLDLGCSEGSTTFGISQMGSTVYGVEGRADGVERARVLKDIIGFGDTHFSVGNVDYDEAYREVDGIFNAGVLYHLEDPVACMERCVRNARQFVMVDTGHAPRSAEERANSRFAPNFGKRYQIEYQGLTLDVENFAEPRFTEEKGEEGRRGPRAGIGNTNSVWLAHHSLIALMEKLGFPHHETIADKPAIPRLRTVFWREKPRPAKPLGPLHKPLPSMAGEEEAIANTRARDIAYLQRTKRPVAVVGREPLLSAVADDLRSNGIDVNSVNEVPGSVGDKIHRSHLNALMNDRGGLVAVAVPDPYKTIYGLMLLDRFDYAFSSFALAQTRRLAHV